MSGGHFSSSPYYILDITEELKDEVVDQSQYEEGYSEATLDEFYRAVDLLEKAYIYVRRIDYLLSGDYSEETFHESLKEDLKKIQ